MTIKTLARWGRLAAMLPAVTMAVGFAEQATAINLGTAADYNVFVLEDFHQKHTDVEGKLAVGGDLIFEEGFAVGMKLRGEGNGNILRVGGDVTLDNGKVYGDGTYGGTTTIGGNVYNDTNFVGAAGNVGFEIIAEGTDNQKLRDATFKKENDSSFFAAAGTYLRNLSQSLNDLALDLYGGIESVTTQLWGNSTTTVATDKTKVQTQQWAGDPRSQITFTGTEQGLNVFDIGAGDLENISELNLQVPEESTVLINVRGDVATLGGFGFFLGEDKRDCNQGGTTSGSTHLWCRDRAQNVLFNFSDAKTLNLSEIGFMGSILAPNADVNFSNGHINGNLIARSLKGDGQSNLHLFNSQSDRVAQRELVSEPESVPEPATLAGLGLVAVGLGVSRRRKARVQ